MRLALAVLLAGAPAAAAPITAAELYCREALGDLVAVPEQDRPFTRYLALAALPDERVESWGVQVTNWWVHQLSTGPDVVVPARVSRRMLRVDLRDYRWNAAAWAAVAAREPYTREPEVSPETAQSLRLLAGVRQDPKTLAVDVVVRGDWLVRETMESDRSTSYYDLLFANQRFKGGAAKDAEGKVEFDHPGGRYTSPTTGVTQELKAGRYWHAVKKTSAAPVAFVDFPKNLKDWDEFFGVTAVKELLAKQQINVENGAVVAGSSDDPKNGSIVARNNRVVFILPIPTGVALQTFDAKRTAGDTDYLENAPDVAVGNIKSDAGELLASLPNGGQAGLLIDGQGNRAEVAPTTFAHNKADPRFVDVRTMMGCVTCHAPTGGFIPPRNLVPEILADGVEVKIKDREVRNRVRAFYLDWDDKVKGWQRPYEKLITRTTATVKEPKGLTPAKLVAEFLAYRNWYDDPVSLEQAVRELGGKPDPARFTGKARIVGLIRGRAVPRQAWESDVYRDTIEYLLTEE